MRPPVSQELSAEQLTTIINSFLGLAHRELVSLVKEFYGANQRWPADATELRSFVRTNSHFFGSKFDMIMPYKDLQIVENETGDCLVSYTSKDKGYEAKITVFRPRN